MSGSGHGAGNVCRDGVVRVAPSTRERALRRVVPGAFALAVVSASPLLFAQSETTGADDTAPARAAGVAGVVVAGLGGTPAYGAAFEAAAETVADALATLDPMAEPIVRLGTGGPADGPVGDRTGDATGESAGGAADRATLLAAIEREGAREADLFALVLIGHGNVDGGDWKFNVSGPDPSGDDLVGALANVRARQQLVVLGASASGALLETLAQPGRVVVTATKSGGELNAVRFPGFLAEALGSAVADVDRNEILTVAEAFRFADARTREHYEEANLLASEHARVAGDEAASMAVARLGSLRLAGDDPAVAALLDTRLTLERSYRALLARKDELPPDDYYAELETLMLSIAGLQRAIDRASGWSDDDADS